MKALLTWFTIFVLAASGLAQTAAAPATPKKRAHKAAVAPAPPAVTTDDLKALRDALAQQQAQIQDLQGKMAERDATLQQTQQQLQQAQSQLQDTQSKAATAVTTASQTSDSVSKLQSDVADIRTNTTNAAVSTQEDQKKISVSGFPVTSGCVARPTTRTAQRSSAKTAIAVEFAYASVWKVS